MTNEELGKTLSEARIARGLTLRDVERDTRISLRYLEALEQGDLEVLPAPVYARAFTRTYAQYLGLNATAMVQALPGARPEPELPPLPDYGKEVAESRISASWVVAGIVIVILFGAGLVLFFMQGGGDDGDALVENEPPAATASGQGAEQPTVPTAEAQPIDVTAGVVPDVKDEHVLAALAALDEADLSYMIIEVESEQAQPEIVHSQSPSPQTEADDSTVVTLVVGRSSS
jgi:cytoskeleton protein RodZ